MKAFIKAQRLEDEQSTWVETNLSIEESIRHYAKFEFLKIEWTKQSGEVESLIIEPELV